MRSVAPSFSPPPPPLPPPPALFIWGGGRLLFVVVVLLLLFVVALECCLKHLEKRFRSNDIYRLNSKAVFFPVKNATFISDLEKNKIKFRVKIKRERTDAV